MNFICSGQVLRRKLKKAPGVPTTADLRQERKVNFPPT
jgi:hypothetical protein